MSRVVFGIPAYGHQIDASHAAMWLGIGSAMEVNAQQIELVGLGVVDECNLARARNQLVAHSITSGADWLVTVDADTTIRNPDSVIQMIAAGAQHNAAVVGAPVRHRTIDAWNVHADTNRPVPMSEWEDKVVPVHAIGAAVMAISINWINENWPTVEDPWFKFVHVMNNLWAGEDIVFCAGVRKRGGTIFCDGRVKTAHRARAGYLE